MARDIPPGIKIDDFLASWTYSEYDRTQNVINLDSLNIQATIGQRGKITFSMRVLVFGKRVRKTIGHFQAKTFRYHNAIVKAGAILEQLEDEQNGKPHVAAKDIPTLAELVTRYEKAREHGENPMACPGGRKLPKSWLHSRPMVLNLYAPLMDRPTITIRREEIVKCHTDYLDARHRETGKRPTSSVRYSFNAAHPMFIYARNMYWMRPETLMGLTHGMPKEEKRRRLLGPREWQLAAPALDSLANDVGILPRFLLATACRLNMACTMRWEDLREVNVGTRMKPKKLMIWSVPKENMKQGFAALFPIVGEALRLVNVLREKAGGSPNDLDYVFSDSPRKAWMNNPHRWQKIVFAKSGTKSWHRHDLRRTTATLLKFVGADYAMVKRLLAHQEEGDGSATENYLVIDENLPALAALAPQLEKVHALQRDMEEGRVTEELERLYAMLDTTPGVGEFLKTMKINRRDFMEVVPNSKHAVATIHELHAPQVQP